MSAGTELRIALAAWESALKNVPDAYLSRAYERAAENWPWTDGKAFTADAVAQAYTLLVVEERQSAEAERRNAARRDKETFRCYHCQDIGYQPLCAYNGVLQRWYTSLRPCCCETTPIDQRVAFPLQEPEYARGKFIEWVSRAEMDKYGAPPKFFRESHA